MYINVHNEVPERNEGEHRVTDAEVRVHMSVPLVASAKVVLNCMCCIRTNACFSYAVIFNSVFHVIVLTKKKPPF